MNIEEIRKPFYPINEIFINRWSPRAMSGELITKDELFTLFEAARWSPSSYNAQPWRFLYATRDSEHWKTFLNLLVEFNQQWCRNAAALVLVVSRKTFEHNGKPAATHSLDTGSAWMSVALQGSLLNLVVHGMQGFDYKKAKQTLNIPEDHVVEMMFAVGRPGKKEDLPEAMQEKETLSQRKDINEIINEGPWKE